MHRIISISTFLSLLFSLLCSAQEPMGQVEGCIRTQSGTRLEPLPFVNVAVFVAGDTTQVVAGSATDSKGKYLISDLPAGSYRLSFLMIGFETIDTVFHIDAAQRVFRYDATMRETHVALSEVHVKAARTRYSVDKQTFSFTDAQVKQARYAQDLVVLLPQMKRDLQTNNLVDFAAGTSPLILLNGVVSSDEVIKMIPPNKVIRVDYYNIPPARYNTVSAVIDVITKPLDDGHNGGADLQLNPLHISGNIRTYYSYNTGYHQLQFFGSGSLMRPRLGSREERTLGYELGTKLYTYQQDARYNTDDVILSGTYTYSRPNDLIFKSRISASRSFSKDYTKVEGYSKIGGIETQRMGENKMRAKELSPAVDLYFEKQWEGKKRLSTNAVMTFYSVDQSANMYERAGLTPSAPLLYQDTMSIKSNKASLIAQIDYGQPLGKTHCSLGYRTHVFRSDYQIFSLLMAPSDSPDVQWQGLHRFYTAFSGSLGKVSFYVSPALSIYTASAHRGQAKRHVSTSFTPYLALSYNPHAQQQIRLEVEASNLPPQLSQTTDLIRQVRQGHYYRNNPQLRTGFAFSPRLNYSLSSKYVDLNVRCSYSYITNPFVIGFSQEVIDGKEAVVQSPANGIDRTDFSTRTSVLIKPLHGTDALQLRISATPAYRRYVFRDKPSESLWQFKSSLSASYSFKNFGIQGECSLPYRELQSYFTVKNEWSSGLLLWYRLNSWQIHLSCQNLFAAEQSHSTNFASLPVSEQLTTTRRDFHWRLGIGLSFYFSRGKEYSGGSKRLDNEDSNSTRL